jgi:hypothetical protein
MVLWVLVMFSLGANRLYVRHNPLRFVIWFYALTLTATGWHYVIRQKKVSGITHALLMLSIAAPSLFFGLPIIFDSSNYHGADAPAGGMALLGGLGLTAIGALTAFCGVTVMRGVLSKKVKPTLGQ